MARMKREEAIPKLAKDTTGTFVKNLGWKGEPDGYRQHRFYLGKKAGEAMVRASKLDQVWQAVESRWQRAGKKTPRPVWDATTLAIAQAVSRGEPVVKLEPPAPVERPADLPPDQFWVNDPWDAAALVRWVRGLQEDFPMIRLALADEDSQEAGERFWQQEAEDLTETARRLQRKNTRQTLFEALDAFKDYLPSRPKYSDIEGRLTQTGQVAMKEVALIKEHAEDVSLCDLDEEVMQTWETYWVKRPMSKRNSPMASKTCSNIIKRVRMFFRWLHRNKAFDWRTPDDYEPVKVEFTETGAEKAKRANTRQVETYSPEELALLWKHAKPKQRLLMALALNCGYGIAELASLQTSEIHLDTRHPEYDVPGSFIMRLRPKTDVYGEHQLWGVTVEAIKWYLAHRPKTGETALIVNKVGVAVVKQTSGGNRAQAIPNSWNALVERVRRLENLPTFRKLSFNKLRKTAINGIRKACGGEVAGIFAFHGQPVKSDALLDVYSNRDFERVFQAIERLREKLAPMFDAVAEPFQVAKRQHRKDNAYLAQRRDVLALRALNKTYRQIATELNISYRAVVRHCQQSGAGGRAKVGENQTSED